MWIFLPVTFAVRPGPTLRDESKNRSQQSQYQIWIHTLNHPSNTDLGLKVTPAHRTIESAAKESQRQRVSVKCGV